MGGWIGWLVRASSFTICWRRWLQKTFGAIKSFALDCCCRIPLLLLFRLMCQLKICIQRQCDDNECVCSYNNNNDRTKHMQYLSQWTLNSQQQCNTHNIFLTFYMISVFRRHNFFFCCCCCCCSCCHRRSCSFYVRSRRASIPSSIVRILNGIQTYSQHLHLSILSNGMP